MTSPVVPSCESCGERPAPFGFHLRFFCRDHKTHGEALISAPVAVKTALPPVPDAPGFTGPRQGRLL